MFSVSKSPALCHAYIWIAFHTVYYSFVISVMADCPHTIGVEFGTRIIEVPVHIPIQRVLWSEISTETCFCLDPELIFFLVLLQVSGQKIKLQIWDTAGQER